MVKVRHLLWPVLVIGSFAFFSLWFSSVLRQDSNALMQPLVPLEAAFTQSQHHPTTNPILIWSDQTKYHFDGITAQSYLLIKLTKSQDHKYQATILAQKQASQPLSIASLTKIMTAWLVLDKYDLDESIIISLKAAQTGEASMNLKAGQSYTVRELLWGLLLNSANDAAEALAGHWPNGRDGFISTMNQYAKKLNLTATHFVNPSGLDEDDGRYNTASSRDLAILSSYVYFNYPLFRQIVGSQSYLLSGVGHPQRRLYNKMGLAKTYPGIVGIKSGNSQTAQMTVVELLKKGNDYYMLILLGSLHPKKEVRYIFNTLFGT